MKICSKCKQNKEDSDYYKTKQLKSGLLSACKACISAGKAWSTLTPEQKKKRRIAQEEGHKKYRTSEKGKAKRRERRMWTHNKERERNWHLKKNYGLTQEQYEGMFLSQLGKCAICGKHQSELAKLLAVDHNHSTGAIRGLLCVSCNVGIGNLGDSLEKVNAAVSYLTAWEKK